MSKKKAQNGLGAIFPPQKMKRISLLEVKKILTETPPFQERLANLRDALLVKLESKCHEVNPKDLPCSRSVVSVLTDKPRFFVRPSDPLDLENFLDVCESLKEIHDVLSLGPKNAVWLAEAGYYLGWRQARLNIRPFEGDVKNSIDKEERDKQNLRGRYSKVTPKAFKREYAAAKKEYPATRQITNRKRWVARKFGLENKNSVLHLNRLIKEWRAQGITIDLS